MRKQLFYLTNHELTAYSCHGANVALENIFENDENGWQRFADYLSDMRSMPAYFLVDLIEEDFQRDSVPHAVGKARQALLERKLTQLYRDTPFRHAVPQGREKEGRKDDRILFNALTNAELPKPWLSAVLKHAVPIVGIYSLPLLSQILFDKLHVDDGPLLLVTHQSSGLRQSYFHEGYLRFSRLTPLFGHAEAHLAESFASETAKTRQFLASTRLLGRGEKIQIVAFANAQNLVAMQDGLEDTSATYRFIEIEEGRKLLKLGGFDQTADCDLLFLSLLTGGRIASHYPLRDQRHFYQLWQIRIALYAFSGVIAIAALIWAGIDVVNIFEQRRETDRLEMEAVAAEYKYQAVVKNMPTTLVNPHNMKSVVDIERMIAQNAPSPEVLMAGISKALDALPQIIITRLQWQVVDTSTLAVAADANAPPPPPQPVDAAPQAALLGLPDKPSQVVILEGEIQPFNGDYRAALESVRMFAAELQKDKQLRAEITLQPLDTRPTVKLENSAGEEKKGLTARFAMKLIRKP